MKFGIGDWAMEILGGILVAVGVGGLTMFGNAKTKIDARLTRLEDWHHDKIAHLVALQTCQENMAERLDSIETVTRDTNMKLDNLIQVMLKKG